MQIRKRGSNFQLLRRKKNIDREGYTHKTLGAFPVTCRHIDEIDEELCSLLTKREHLQLEEYLDRRRQTLDDTLKKRALADAPKTLKAIGKLIREKFSDNDDAEDFFKAYKILAQALCDQGYGPEIVEITLAAAAKTIPDFELEKEGALRIMLAWVKLKKSLVEHGYTLKMISSNKGNK